MWLEHTTNMLRNVQHLKMAVPHLCRSETPDEPSLEVAEYKAAGLAEIELKRHRDKTEEVVALYIISPLPGDIQAI